MKSTPSHPTGVASSHHDQVLTDRCAKKGMTHSCHCLVLPRKTHSKVSFFAQRSVIVLLQVPLHLLKLAVSSFVGTQTLGCAPQRKGPPAWLHTLLFCPVWELHW